MGSGWLGLPAALFPLQLRTYHDGSLGGKRGGGVADCRLNLESSI